MRAADQELCDRAGRDPALGSVCRGLGSTQGPLAQSKVSPLHLSRDTAPGEV